MIGIVGALALGSTLLIGGSARRESGKGKQGGTDDEGKIWTSGHKIERFDIIPLEEGGDFINMLGQVMFVKYYEDVIDAAIHVEVLISDTYGWLNEAPIRSGCPVNLTISHPSSEEPFTYDIKEEPLVITNISDHMIDNKREVYTLTLETRSAISNHTTRVWKKYIDKISTTVNNVLTEVLEIEPDRIVNIEKTWNKCEFTGNFRRPFKVISKLCPKAIPESADSSSPEDGSAGFLFWETIDGYNFSSIDTLFSEEPEFSYEMTPYKEGANAENNFQVSSNPQWEESHDILKKLRSGAYRTANWYFDILSRQPKFAEYNYMKSVEKGQSKTANDPEGIPGFESGFTDKYSRIILSTIDQGTMTPDVDGDGATTPQDSALFQAQASARYSSLFSQILHITIPMNLSLRAGDVLNIKFSELNTEDKDGGRNTESGKYMIARLSHEFGNPKGDFTGLSLVRDSFQSK